MRYCLAIVLPPLAILLCGKVFQAAFNFLLMITLIGWPLASIWALFVVNTKIGDERQARLIRVMRNHAIHMEWIQGKRA